MPIAIVGIGCRFSGSATNPERLWELLIRGEHCRTEVPKDRFNINAFYHPDHQRQGTMANRGGHYMTGDIAAFDASFFSIASGEAQAMDPQHRIALEIAYEALENGSSFPFAAHQGLNPGTGGIRLEDVAGTSMACYTASMSHDYQTLRHHDPDNVPWVVQVFNKERLLKGNRFYESNGSGMSLLANRISWFLDIKGPSMTLDTACSSSLIALHLACQSLRCGESTSVSSSVVMMLVVKLLQALVGGSNLILMPETQSAMSNTKLLSPDSISKAFDHKADGFGRGEGVAFVVLKPLADAIKNGNVIRAIIRATGVNQDGRTSGRSLLRRNFPQTQQCPGITRPSATAQEDLIRSTYGWAGLDPSATGFVEAHGTGELSSKGRFVKLIHEGTPVGDPLECLAIARTLGKTRQKEDPLLIGSIKPNIGHTEGASGLSGLIKAVFCVEKGRIPPNLYLEKPNPRIHLKDWCLKVSTLPLPRVS